LAGWAPTPSPASASAQILNAVSVERSAATGTVALVAPIGAAGGVRRGVVMRSLYLVLMGLAIAIPVHLGAATVSSSGRARRAGEQPGFARTIMPSVPCMAVFAVVAAGLRGAGDGTPLLIGGVVNLVNVCAAYAHLRQVRPAGHSACGAAGQRRAFAVGAASG
jgi:hypothetical protein